MFLHQERALLVESGARTVPPAWVVWPGLPDAHRALTPKISIFGALFHRIWIAHSSLYMCVFLSFSDTYLTLFIASIFSPKQEGNYCGRAANDFPSSWSGRYRRRRDCIYALYAAHKCRYYTAVFFAHMQEKV